MIRTYLLLHSYVPASPSHANQGIASTVINTHTSIYSSQLYIYIVSSSHSQTSGRGCCILQTCHIRDKPFLFLVLFEVTEITATETSHNLLGNVSCDRHMTRFL